MIVFSNVLKRWSFQKGSRWGMIFLVLSAKVVFFPENTVVFPRTREMTLLKKYTETWYFLFDVFHAPLQKKKKKIKDDPIPQKIHVKVIDTLDRHLRKRSSNSLYFRGDLYSRFRILILSEKKEKKT